MNIWEETTKLTIPVGTQVVAIECLNNGGAGGFLASIEGHVDHVTNASWLCSDKEVEGWTMPGFQDTKGAFSSARVLGTNGIAPWGVRYALQKKINFPAN